MNPWHDVIVGENAPECVNAIIENSKGTRAKYVLDRKTGMLNLECVLNASVQYPANYGFIPKTFTNNAPLDIMVISSISIVPMCIVKANVIGVMRTVKEGANHDKIIAVADGDPSVNYIKEVEDLPEYLKQDVMRFFDCHSKNENRRMESNRLQTKSVACDVIQEAIGGYRNRYV